MRGPDKMFDSEICIFGKCYEFIDGFILTFLSSLLSASFGMTKFLKVGPCRLLPNQGYLGGYLSWSFIFTFFNITISFLFNACIFALAFHMVGYILVILLVKSFLVSYPNHQYNNFGKA